MGESINSYEQTDLTIELAIVLPGICAGRRFRAEKTGSRRQ
jgi:hypothetical protein